MFLIGTNTSSSAPALEDAASGSILSYRDLAGTVSEAARLLARPKSLIFCFCRTSVASIAGYLAAVESGHAVALLDEGLSAEFKARLISLYAPDFLFSSSEQIDFGVPEFDKLYRKAAISAGGLHVWEAVNRAAGAIHADLSVMLSTSGSTGSPKFVRLTRANVECNARSIQQALAITADERPISSLPIHYSYGLSVLNSHLLAGASLILTGAGITAAEFWNTFQRFACTSFAGVPYSYQVLHRLDVERLAGPSLKTMTQAGGKLGNNLIARFHQLMTARGGRFFVMYGQTEATARIAILPAEALPEKLGSAGKAIPGGTLQVEHEGALTSDANCSGELVYRGPNVMMGYATCRDDLALGDVNGGVLRTGDLGFLDDDGFLFITGRIKRDAKVFGLRINMDEVESILRPNGPTAVIDGNDKIFIYCEYGDDQAFSQYTRELATKLKLHAGAIQFQRVDQLPIGANGKIDYARLRAHKPPGAAPGTDEAAPFREPKIPGGGTSADLAVPGESVVRGSSKDIQ